MTMLEHERKHLFNGTEGRGMIIITTVMVSACDAHC